MKKQKNKKTNLIAEIEKFGYKVSVQSLIGTFALVVAGCIAAGYLFKLRPIGYVVVCAVAVMCTFSIIYQSYKAKYEQRRFSDVSIYLERMIYYFSAGMTILDALVLIIKLFPEGEMHDVLEKSINIIKTANVADVDRAALDEIEKAYPVTRIKTLHKFTLQVQQNGGNTELGKKILLNDRKNWVDRTMELQAGKRNFKRDTVVVLAIVTAMCLCALYVPQYVKQLNIDISLNPLVQVTSVILLCANIMIYTHINKFMSRNWLDEKQEKTDEECKKIYDNYFNNNKKRDIIMAAICSGITVIISILVFIKINSAVVFAVAAVLIIFFVKSPTLGKKEVKKQIQRMIEMYYPSWLLQVSLYLATENVPVAMTKTYDDAPGIIKPALYKMLKELDDNPASADPYNNFLSEFDVKEVDESMTALYSLAQSEGGDIEDEFSNLINRNNELTNKAEKLKNEDRLFMMQLNMYLPSAVCCIKMICDFVILFVTFFSSSINILN